MDPGTGSARLLSRFAGKHYYNSFNCQYEKYPRNVPAGIRDQRDKERIGYATVAAIASGKQLKRRPWEPDKEKRRECASAPPLGVALALVGNS